MLSFASLSSDSPKEAEYSFCCARIKIISHIISVTKIIQNTLSLFQYFIFLFVLASKNWNKILQVC